MPYILALDQGTHASRAVLYDAQAHSVAHASLPVESSYPRPGYVEQDAEEIWRTQLAAARAAVASAGIDSEDVAAIGIANQRETTVVWDARTGAPRAPAIVWQCRRSEDVCARLRSEGMEDLVRQRTGLLLDPYFSATKLAWLLREDAALREDALAGRLRFGTVDSWLLYRLTGGRTHASDASNASRTLLFDLAQGNWSEELGELFGVPRTMLGEVLPSCGEFGVADPSLLGAPIPIRAVLGDQQAALFGQRCFSPGDVKTTYGTGAFLLAQTGEEAVRSRAGLLTTVAWDLGQGPRYALEGSVFLAGGILEWLQTEVGLVSSPQEAERLARSVPDAGGVLLVPALAGLGAPFWDPGARGALLGLSRGTTRAHIARAAFDAIALRTDDVLRAMTSDLGQLGILRVDGGVAHSDLLLQLQADLSGLAVSRPDDVETTARGAALLAGLGAGIFSSTDDIARLPVAERRFLPAMPNEARSALRARWQTAVAATRLLRT